ncbi:MAG: RNA polymerase sigma factor [Gemmatimonadaceae bacterium]|nr:RNA polymerase sigma factor [Gemmatimonadaceae bacterium]
MAHAAPPDAPLDAKLEALHDAAFGWACNCCYGNADDAADVLQTCYVKLFSGRAVFDGRSTLRTWWFGVIRFTALELRRHSDRPLSIADVRDTMTTPAHADAAVLDAESGTLLRQALTRLPERQREVLHLVFYQGLSVTEAAQVLELSVGSARVHYDRGKKRLREWLAPLFRNDDVMTSGDHQ